MGRVIFDRPLEGSYINHENDYYRMLKLINKSECTFTYVNNENIKGSICKWNRKHKCALYANLIPSDSFQSSLTHRKYVTKCNDKNINTLQNILLLTVYN